MNNNVTSKVAISADGKMEIELTEDASLKQLLDQGYLDVAKILIRPPLVAEIRLYSRIRVLSRLDPRVRSRAEQTPYVGYEASRLYGRERARVMRALLALAALSASGSELKQKIRHQHKA